MGRTSRKSSADLCAFDPISLKACVGDEAETVTDMDCSSPANHRKEEEEEPLSASDLSDSEGESSDCEEEDEEDQKMPLALEGAPPGFNGGRRRVSLPFCGKERKDSLEDTRIPIGELKAKVERVQQGVIGRVCKDWLILWPLGQGNGGRVYLGQHVNTGEKVAIKIISKAEESNARTTHKRIKRAMKEACIMQRLKGHKHIVQLYEVFEDEENVFLIMQVRVPGSLLVGFY